MTEFERQMAQDVLYAEFKKKVNNEKAIVELVSNMKSLIRNAAANGKVTLDFFAPDFDVTYNQLYEAATRIHKENPLIIITTTDDLTTIYMDWSQAVAELRAEDKNMLKEWAAEAARYGDKYRG